MAVYIGQIPEFNSATMKWKIYMERVNTFFEANDVEEDAKKRAVFLTSVGERTYTTLRNLTSPETLANTSWANIQKLLKDHYMPLANPRC